MTITEKDGKWIIIHAGKTLKEKFDTENAASSYANRNIDDQVFDGPNTFMPPLEYDIIES